jgi:hypothetical protein
MRKQPSHIAAEHRVLAWLSVLLGLNPDIINVGVILAGIGGTFETCMADQNCAQHFSPKA